MCITSSNWTNIIRFLKTLTVARAASFRLICLLSIHQSLKNIRTSCVSINSRFGQNWAIAVWQLDCWIRRPVVVILGWLALPMTDCRFATNTSWRHCRWNDNASVLVCTCLQVVNKPGAPSMTCKLFIVRFCRLYISYLGLPDRLISVSPSNIVNDVDFLNSAEETATVSCASYQCLLYCILCDFCVATVSRWIKIYISKVRLAATNHAN